jgi:glycosyltransferase involved in cell wall biosynthesis
VSTSKVGPHPEVALRRRSWFATSLISDPAVWRTFGHGNPLDLVHLKASLQNSSDPLPDPAEIADRGGNEAAVAPTSPSGGPLHVLHLVLSMEIGGLEQVVLDLAREGQRLGQRITVVCLEKPGQLAAEVEALGIEVMCVRKRPGIRLGMIRRLKEVMRNTRPDVVHSHQLGALFYGGPAARALGIPVVHSEHGKHYASRWRNRWLGRIAGRHAARFLCVSQDIAAEVRRCRVAPVGKIDVVPNGIDIARFSASTDTGKRREALGIPPDAPVVGTIGRLNEVKRQDLLLRAFAQLRLRIPGIHLVVVGDGPARDDLKRLGNELGLEGSVHFTGHQPQPESYLGMMDVFALTSHSEGMPLVVLEAWAAGVPVVASRVGGLVEMIDSGRNGILFDFGDEEGLLAGLSDCITNRDHAQQLRGAARREVEDRYGLQHMVRAYLQHYLNVLNEAKTIGSSY